MLMSVYVTERSLDDTHTQVEALSMRTDVKVMHSRVCID